MAFASHCGLNITTDASIEHLFNEELGCVIQVKAENKQAVNDALVSAGLGQCTHSIATINTTDTIEIIKTENPFIANLALSYIHFGHRLLMKFPN